MTLWWCSWWQPGDDYRPLTYPPNEAILGWWCSGMGGIDFDFSSICALVQAPTEDAVREAIAKDWPESKSAEWRFCREKNDATLGDRFPLDDWMRERIAKVVP